MPPTQARYNALLRVLRITGTCTDDCFASAHSLASPPLSSSSSPASLQKAQSVWMNDAIYRQDTCVTVQLIYPGDALLCPSSSAALHIAITPMKRGTMSPSLCVISLGTQSATGSSSSSSTHQEVVVKEWDLAWSQTSTKGHAEDGSVHLSIPLRTVHTVVSLLAPAPVGATTPLLLTLRFLGHVDGTGVHCLRRVCLDYDQLPATVEAQWREPQRLADRPARAPTSSSASSASSRATASQSPAWPRVTAQTPKRHAPASPSQSLTEESSLIEVSPPSPPTARVRTESPRGEPDLAIADHARSLDAVFADAQTQAWQLRSPDPNRHRSAREHLSENQLHASIFASPPPSSMNVSGRAVRSPSLASLLEESANTSATKEPSRASPAVIASAQMPPWKSHRTALSDDEESIAPIPFCAEADVLWRLQRVLAASSKPPPPPASIAPARTLTHKVTPSLFTHPSRTPAHLGEAPAPHRQEWREWRRRRSGESRATVDSSSSIASGSHGTALPSTTVAHATTDTDTGTALGISPLLWTWPSRHDEDRSRVGIPARTSRSSAASSVVGGEQSMTGSVLWVDTDHLPEAAAKNSTTPAVLRPHVSITSTPEMPEVTMRSDSAVPVLATAGVIPTTPLCAAAERDQVVPLEMCRRNSADDASSPSPGRPPSPPPVTPPRHALSAMNANVPFDYWLSKSKAPESDSEAARTTTSRHTMEPAAEPAPSSQEHPRTRRESGARGHARMTSPLPPPLLLTEAAEPHWCLPPSVTFDVYKHHATRVGIGQRKLTLTRTQAGSDARGRPTYVTDIALTKVGARRSGLVSALEKVSARLRKPSARRSRAARMDAADCETRSATTNNSFTSSVPTHTGTPCADSEAGGRTSSLTVYQDDVVQVLSGAGACRSGYLHLDFVRSPPCCLVLLCNDELVTAVEFISPEERMLATSLLTASALPTGL